MNDKVCIEWLQYISRDKTVVYARVLVLLQLWELLLSYVDHVGQSVHAR